MKKLIFSATMVVALLNAGCRSENKFILSQENKDAFRQSYDQEQWLRMDSADYHKRIYMGGCNVDTINYHVGTEKNTLFVTGLGKGVRVKLNSYSHFLQGKSIEDMIIEGEAFITVDSVASGGKEFRFKSGNGLFLVRNGSFNVSVHPFTDMEDKIIEGVLERRVTVLSGAVHVGECDGGGFWVNSSHDGVVDKTGTFVLANDEPDHITWMN